MVKRYGARYWPARRIEYGRYATPDSRPPPLKVLVSPLPKRYCERSWLLAKESGWMKRAGSVGPHVPWIDCHWRVRLIVPWKLCDMFFASVASITFSSTYAQVRLFSWKIWPRFGSTSPKPPNG